MRVGRHDWVYAGCPTSIDAIVDGIQKMEGASFDSLRRLITIQKKPDFLINAIEKISSAAIARLSNLLNSSEDAAYSVVREGLYYILSSYPSLEAVEILEACTRKWPEMDGDPARPAGMALADALTSCRKSQQA